MTKFLGPEVLGRHGYRYSLSEKNGIVYTCKAGHIDISHVRIAADWTAYLTAKSFDCLMRNKAGFSFKLKVDRTKHFVRISYPQDWKGLAQEDKEEIAREVSIKLGQYLAYTATTWHEILTWFGFKCMGLYPEFPSAFSWEDSFSNLLGSHIAVQALRDPEHEFNEAMTLLIDEELAKLGVQERHVAIQASKSVRGEWFSGNMFVKMKKRNFDIGLDDGYVTPSLVGSVCECEGAKAQVYAAPKLDFLGEYGFSVQVRIEPREWEKSKILKIVYPNTKNRRKRLNPAIHFAKIMDFLKKEAVIKYDYDIGLN
ncbi:DUF4056 domain-containing protein [Planctomycetota bacterium]